MFVKFSLSEDYRGLPRDVFIEENVLLGQQTFIYGRNGSGKTTFSEALRLLGNGDDKAPKASFTVVDQGDVAHRAWNAGSMPFQIHVFNRYYVDHSLSPFIKGEADAEGLVHIGSESVDASVEINEINELLGNIEYVTNRLSLLRRKAQEEEEALLREAQTEIIADLSPADPGKYTRQGFNIAKVKRVLGESPTGLDVDEFERQLRIAKTETPSPIRPPHAPKLPSELEPEQASRNLLSLTPKQAQLQSLQGNNTLQSWVEEGMTLHDAGEACLFCAEGVYSNDRKIELEGHFSDEFTSLRMAARQGLRNLQHYIEKLEAFKTAIVDLRTTELLEGGNEFRTLIDEKVLEVDEVLALAQGGVEIFKQKIDNPAEDLTWEGSSEEYLLNVDDFNDMCLRHNTLVESSDRLKASAMAAIEAHHVATVSTAISRRRRKQERCAAFARTLEGHSVNKKLKLSELRAKMEDTEELAKRIDSDVRYVFGHHGLSITTAGDGKAYRIMRAGAPAKDLSEGEGNAIAFAYFLNSLSAEGIDLPNSLVVVDDPVTSLDKDALFAGYSLAMERLSTAGQLIILTHDFDYFRLLLNSKIPERRLKLTSPSEKEVDKDKIFPRQSVLELLHGTSRRRPRLRRIATNQGKALSEYHYLFQLVGNALMESDESDDLRLYGNAGRRLLEGFIAFRAPHKTDFQARVDHVRESCDGAIRQDLSVRMVKFLHAGSHRTDPSPASSLDVTSVVADLSAVMEFIAMSDPGHFAGMCRASELEPDRLVDSVAIGGR